jgi:hypothetical protein
VADVLREHALHVDTAVDLTKTVSRIVGSTQSNEHSYKAKHLARQLHDALVELQNDLNNQVVALRSK